MVRIKPATRPAVPEGGNFFPRERHWLTQGLAWPSAGRRGVPLFAGFSRSEPAPIGRYSVIAMQLRFLRAIAPVEILVGTERRRAPQLVIVDVELIGLELAVVAK